jgi:hypothetical protein
MGRLVTDEKSKDIEPHTLTIKFGMSKNVPKRGIKSEFLSYANASTKKNTSIGKYEVTDEIHMLSIDGKQSCCVAPESLIADWESFVNLNFYNRSPRLFQDAGTKGSKHEYLDAPQETEERSKYIIGIIMKRAPKFAELKPQYEELTDDNTVLSKRVFRDYKAIFDDMKKQLNNYGIKKQKVVKPVQLPVVQSAPLLSTTIQSGLVDIFDTMDSDWTLCKFNGTSIVGLQHNVYHADDKGNLKDPNKDFNLLLSDLDVKDARFQFHSNSFLVSRYTPYNASTKRTVDALIKAGKVRYFDIKDLPPKGKKMLARKQITAPITDGKVVTNGVNHSSPAAFTNI